jgi:hypothetical protein
MEDYVQVDQDSNDFLDELKLHTLCYFEEFTDYLHDDRGWDLEEDGSWNKTLDSYLFEGTVDHTHLWRKSPKFLKDILDFSWQHWGVFLDVMEERKGLDASDVMGEIKKIYDIIDVDPWWSRRKNQDYKHEFLWKNILEGKL